MPRRKTYHNPHTQPPKPPTRFLWVLEASFVALCVFIVLAFVLIMFLAATNHNKAQDAIEGAAKLFSLYQAPSNYQKVQSTLGFELTYNNLLQTAEGTVETTTGKSIKTGTELTQPSSYTTVDIYKKASSQSSSVVSSAVSSTYVRVSTSAQKDFFGLHKNLGTTNQQIAEAYFAPASDSVTSFKQVKSETIVLNGYNYKKLSYEVTHNGAIPFVTLQTDYITVQNDRPYKATLFQNSGYSESDKPSFEAIINSLKYSAPGNSVQYTSYKAAQHQNTITVLGSIFATSVAHAAESSISDDTEISVVAKNQPAVVRIATTYCPDFKLRLHSVEQSFSGGCSAQFGSGFIISPNGLVATNGHVVKSSVADVMVDSVAVRNIPMIKSYLQFLVKSGLLSQSSADKALGLVQSGDDTILKQLIGSLADPQLDNVEFTVTQDQGFYAIQLGKQAVKFNLNNLKQFELSDQIVGAKLVDADYDPYDNKDGSGFKKSDVALLQIEAPNNYPYMKLGSISGLGQGSPLTVIGFPGVADNNDLVSSDQSIPSATRGSVSAIRDAKGNGNKLIQSDVSIAPGNSGGPALDKNGNVVGIATYGLTGEQQGGNYNYMRDVADLKILLSKNHINLPDGASGLEGIWQRGLRNFSKAYYSAAITDFEKVKSQYPPFYLADDFIARAQSEKANGKEATSPEVYYVIAVLFAVLLVVPAVILFVVIKHHHRRRDAHEAYTKVQDQAKIPPVNPVAVQSTAKTPEPSRQVVDMIQVAPGHTEVPSAEQSPVQQQQPYKIPIDKPPA